ncbi:hypothetical protein V2G26_019956 [Clonostachys chloroleuca]
MCAAENAKTIGRSTESRSHTRERCSGNMFWYCCGQGSDGESNCGPTLGGGKSRNEFEPRTVTPALEFPSGATYIQPLLPVVDAVRGDVHFKGRDPRHVRQPARQDSDWSAHEYLP